MADDVKNVLPEEEEESPVFPLVDEETGKTENFELLAEWEDGDNLYYAMAPADDETIEEYVILKVTEEENGDLTFESIDDDDEFERVSDYFDDLFMGEIDYDKN